MHHIHASFYFHPAAHDGLLNIACKAAVPLSTGSPLT
jgi:hypothetical protein